MSVTTRRYAIVEVYISGSSQGSWAAEEPKAELADISVLVFCDMEKEKGRGGM